MKLILKVGAAAVIGGVVCLASSWRASSATKVKLRGVVHLLNALKRKPKTEEEIEAVIKPAVDLFEKVLEAERWVILVGGGVNGGWSGFAEFEG